MALDTGQQVRLRIQDAPIMADVTRYGDGTATLFQFEHRNITAATAYVPLGNTAWTATGCTFNASGWVEFSGVVSANSAWRARYTHSTFSEDEIAHFTAVGGGVAGAALEAVRVLMFDSLKRASWAAPDGSTFDDTKVMGQLNTLHDQLKEEVAGAELLQGGGFIDWAINQEDW